jgi:hypothetical protein
MYKNMCKFLACVAMMYNVASMAMTPISAEQRQAFLMSMIGRLGVNSPASKVDRFIRRIILSYIPETRNVTVLNYDEARLVVRITDDREARTDLPIIGLDVNVQLGVAPIMLAPKKRRAVSSASIPSRLSVTLPVSYLRAEVMDSEGLHTWYSFILTPRQVASMATLQVTQRCATHIGYDGDSIVVGSQEL